MTGTGPRFATHQRSGDLVEAVTRQRVVRCAYRTLGLSASASQTVIDATARRMRLWPDPARIPMTPWDILKLGPLCRTRADVERAAARLREPASRLGERLVWFHGAQFPPMASPVVTDVLSL